MIELLAPAGNLEKMNLALQYNADAVYFGLPDFSLRARSNQFTKEDIIKAQTICRKKKKKFYITMNIYAHNIHLEKIKEQLQWLKKNNINPDGLIIADPGIIRLVKKYLPGVEIHLSTQANVTNLEAVKFWQEVGVTRIVLAREVTVDEIKEIHQAVPEMELEVFVHGAMCMSYSGRCILSKWMTNRSANLGDCAQPCRWRWQENTSGNKKKDISGCPSCSAENKGVELIDDQQRFGMKVEEDQHGTYMFNSYDIALIEHLDKLINAGVVSFKIEGRAKSVYYLGVIVKTYRQVLDCLSSGKDCTDLINQSLAELNKMSNRGYWTGFILGDEPPHLFDKAYLPVEWEFVGLTNVGREDSMIGDGMGENNNNNEDLLENESMVFVHNKLISGDKVQLVGVNQSLSRKVISIENEEGDIVESAHGGLGKIFKIKFNKNVPAIFLLRKKIN